MSTWARILITLLCMSTFARWREKRSLLHNPRYFAKWMSRFPGAEMNASLPQRIVSDVHLSKAQKVEHCVDITTISCMPSSSQHLSYNLGLNWFKVYCFDVSWWRVQLIARQPVHLFFVCVEIRWWCVGFCWNRWVRGFFINFFFSFKVIRNDSDPKRTPWDLIYKDYAVLAFVWRWNFVLEIEVFHKRS